MSNWITAAQLDDIPVLGSRIVRHAQQEIALFRCADDSVFALRNQCPHKKGPLSEGIVHGQTVTCPLHNWKIDLASGEAQGPDEGCTNTFEVKVESGAVMLAL